jgi:hypothetical protein
VGVSAFSRGQNAEENLPWTLRTYSFVGYEIPNTKEGYYKTRSAYTSDTDFRFLMTNCHPAYVYAFAAQSLDPKAVFGLLLAIDHR